MAEFTDQILQGRRVRWPWPMAPQKEVPCCLSFCPALLFGPFPSLSWAWTHKHIEMENWIVVDRGGGQI